MFMKDRLQEVYYQELYHSLDTIKQGHSSESTELVVAFVNALFDKEPDPQKALESYIQAFSNAASKLALKKAS